MRCSIAASDSPPVSMHARIRLFCPWRRTYVYPRWVTTLRVKGIAEFRVVSAGAHLLGPPRQWRRGGRTDIGLSPACMDLAPGDGVERCLLAPTLTSDAGRLIQPARRRLSLISMSRRVAALLEIELDEVTEGQALPLQRSPGGSRAAPYRRLPGQGRANRRPILLSCSA